MISRTNSDNPINTKHSPYLWICIWDQVKKTEIRKYTFLNMSCLVFPLSAFIYSKQSPNL